MLIWAAGGAPPAGPGMATSVVAAILSHSATEFSSAVGAADAVIAPSAASAATAIAATPQTDRLPVMCPPSVVFSLVSWTDPMLGRGCFRLVSDGQQLLASRPGEQRMEFRILGPLEAWDGGRELSLGGRKPRALLTALLLRANEVVSADRLIDELWGDESAERASGALRVNVSRLRKALPHDVLMTRAPGYFV